MVVLDCITRYYKLNLGTSKPYVRIVWNSYTMVRKLKYHEKKLLKKVDFISWQSDNNIQEVKALRKYHIQKREDYAKYVPPL